MLGFSLENLLTHIPMQNELKSSKIYIPFVNVILDQTYCRHVFVRDEFRTSFKLNTHIACVEAMRGSFLLYQTLVKSAC